MSLLISIRWKGQKQQVYRTQLNFVLVYGEQWCQIADWGFFAYKSVSINDIVREDSGLCRCRIRILSVTLEHPVGITTLNDGRFNALRDIRKFLLNSLLNIPIRYTDIQYIASQKAKWGTDTNVIVQRLMTQTRAGQGMVLHYNYICSYFIMNNLWHYCE